MTKDALKLLMQKRKKKILIDGKTYVKLGSSKPSLSHAFMFYKHIQNELFKLHHNLMTILGENKKLSFSLDSKGDILLVQEKENSILFSFENYRGTVRLQKNGYVLEGNLPQRWQEIIESYETNELGVENPREYRETLFYLKDQNKKRKQKLDTLVNQFSEHLLNQKEALAQKLTQSIHQKTNENLSKVFKLEPHLLETDKKLIDEHARECASKVNALTKALEDKLSKITASNFLLGERSEKLTKTIFSLGIKQTARQAKLLAVDQVHKINAKVQQTQAQSFGFDDYIWNSMEDNRVRHTHSVLNGKKYSYKNPPKSLGMNPGEDYGCRCYADIIIPKREGE